MLLPEQEHSNTTYHYFLYNLSHPQVTCPVLQKPQMGNKQLYYVLYCTEIQELTLWLKTLFILDCLHLEMYQLSHLIFSLQRVHSRYDFFPYN